MRIKLALVLVFVLLGCPAILIPKQVLSENVNTRPGERITLQNRRRTANHDNFKEATVDFRPRLYDVVRGPSNEWDLLYGSVNFNGDRDWFLVPSGRRGRSRIRDLGNMDWSDDIAVPVLPILPCRTNELCGGFRIPPSSSGKKIQDEDVNPHIAKPMVGHMYLVHTHRIRPRSRGFNTLLEDFYTLVRVEELKPNESCTITWKIIPSPKK